MNTREIYDLKDIYFTKEYGLIYENNNEGKLEQYVLNSEVGTVIYNFLKRKIDLKKDKELYDIITPYGYGGPLFINYEEKNLEILVTEFKEKFEQYCKENKIVSEFIRFHPFIENHKFMDKYSTVDYIRDTIFIDLESKDKIWANLSQLPKREIKKANKNGVSIVISDKEDDLNDFMNVYNQTMKRNNAKEYYFFKESFFEDTFKLLKNNIYIFKAIYDNKCISSSLIMKYGDYMHYHFSGNDSNYTSLGANHLLIYEAALWGEENGVKYFHLGGGYLGNDDNIFRFKKSFNKNGVKNFYIGKKIHMQNEYDELVQICNKEGRFIEDVNYFPKYRI